MDALEEELNSGNKPPEYNEIQAIQANISEIIS